MYNVIYSVFMCNIADDNMNKNMSLSTFSGTTRLQKHMSPLDPVLNKTEAYPVVACRLNKIIPCFSVPPFPLFLVSPGKPSSHLVLRPSRL